MSKITPNQPDKLTDQWTLEITKTVLELSAESYVSDGLPVAGLAIGSGPPDVYRNGL